MLEHLDPEIFLLSAEEADDDQDPSNGCSAAAGHPGRQARDRASSRRATRADVRELERAGVDAVIVSGSDVESLVGDTPPEV